MPDDRTLPALQDILVVSSTEPGIEHFRRESDGWKILDPARPGKGTLHLENFSLTLDLAELYRGASRLQVAQTATLPASLGRP